MTNDKECTTNFDFNLCCSENSMSLNLTVPTDSPNATSKPRILRRAKSPGAAVQAVKNAHHRNSGISGIGSARNQNIRGKSKSPNPSFNSVLNRVKDWEVGAFTPKTALADNGVVHQIASPISNSDI
jgi:hypothetical protein